MRITLIRRRPILFVVTLSICAVVALASGYALIHNARYGNLGRDMSEVQWYKDQRVKAFIAEGVTPEEARLHSIVFGHLYTLADDTAFSKRCFTFAYALLSFAVLCSLACSIVAVTAER